MLSLNRPFTLSYENKKIPPRLVWTFRLGAYPPPYRSLDILALKVWMYKIMFWENLDQSNFLFWILVGGLVGDPRVFLFWSVHTIMKLRQGHTKPGPEKLFTFLGTRVQTSWPNTWFLQTKMGKHTNFCCLIHQSIFIVHFFLKSTLYLLTPSFDSFSIGFLWISSRVFQSSWP